MTNTIHSSFGIAEQHNVPVKEAQGNIMGKDDFLRILITQLQNQDPLNPMEDKEFIAQMANFSSLEQMTNMNKTLERFITSQQSSALVQNSELIGRKVTWEREVEVDEHRTQTVAEQHGVLSVKQEKDGTIRVLLDNNRWVTNKQIIEIHGQ
ncbi:flagellar hook assembly protein FlgD [Thalassobacillus sp. C254]|uniref:flagellar hook assembly protein FlgD n=1 Tax=Thalassobacillus sp. C254 TaxID=1225341 RepID=UPI0006D0E8CB|nr:flagellar hook assembly protein FlgD [Thalassobacillus sp. C254]